MSGFIRFANRDSLVGKKLAHQALSTSHATGNLNSHPGDPKPLENPVLELPEQNG